MLSVYFSCIADIVSHDDAKADEDANDANDAIDAIDEPPPTVDMATTLEDIDDYLPNLSDNQLDVDDWTGQLQDNVVCMYQERVIFAQKQSCMFVTS